MGDARDNIDDFFEKWGRIKERAEVRNAVKILISHNITPEQYEKIYESCICDREK